MPLASQTRFARLAPLVLLAVTLAACDDKAETAKTPPSPEQRSAPAQQLDEAKARVGEAQDALDARGDAIAEQSQAQ